MPGAAVTFAALAPFRSFRDPAALPRPEVRRI